MASTNKKRNFYRLSLQWLIVGLLAYMVIRNWADPVYIPDYEAYCPVGGLQAFSSFLANHSLACSMTTLQIAMGFALLIAVILMSKLFCSFICPIGIFTEWLGKWGQKFKLRVTITGWADKLLRLLKYGLLFITFYFTIRSSELFCRQYDPFYAVFSGFSGDVVMLYAVLALAITILGSFFIRQFWCKYLCPLGAVSNLFAYTVFFVIVTFVYYLIVGVAGWTLSWIWYLGVLCLGGFILEALKPQTRFFPLLKITRHTDLCTNCKICDKVCPYALNISTVDKVSHIDCHLCGDCVTRCPEKGALKYNGKNWQWMPPVLIVLLVAAGILFSSHTELPTIDIRWGTQEQFEKSAVYEQSGLLGIKCFGSSMSFANQMKEVPGILGVQTFVKHHAVKLYYDPSKITPAGIKEAMFTPVKEILSLPGTEVTRIAAVNTGIDHFFDPSDAGHLAELLKMKPGIFGYETHFGEPVKTLIYFDASKWDKEKIKSVIETKELTQAGEGRTITVDLDFKAAWIRDTAIDMTREGFLQGLFTPYYKTFNDFEKTDTSRLALFETDFFECLYPEKADVVPYLRNHLMADKGIKKFQTVWGEDSPLLRIYYDAARTTPATIRLSLTKPKLHITYKNGETEDIDNPFTFSGIR